VVSGTLAALLVDREPGVPLNHEVWLFDATKPLGPTPIAQLSIDGDASAQAMAGSMLYVTSYAEQRGVEPVTVTLSVVDVSRPAQPTIRSTLDVAGVTGYAGYDWHTAVAADGPSAYVVVTGRGVRGGPVSSALHVIDVTDPRQPAVRARLPLEVAPAHVTFAHGHLLLPGEEGVLVVDVRDPARPAPRGLIPTGGEAAHQAQIQDDLAYVTAGDGGLWVLRPHLEGWPAPPPPPKPGPHRAYLPATGSGRLTP
jgi:hypothetical protein